MNITTIGRGNIGGGLAARWRRAGHEVQELGKDGGDASSADVVLVAVPSGAISDALGARLYDRVDEQQTKPGKIYTADDDAREVTEQLIRDAGFEPVNGGGLENARLQEDFLSIFNTSGSGVLQLLEAVSSAPVRAWEELDPAWREAFTLAWEAYGAGTIPVGAVVTRDGEIIARGRNRLFEHAAPRGEVAGSRIAHAEMNAIAHLPIEQLYHDCVLWSTLEPCPMCIGAAWLGTIGTVRYAGDDAYGGAARLIEAQLERIDRARSDPLTVEGPLPGPFGTLGELLHIDWFVATRPDHRVTRAFREFRPELVALAEQVKFNEHVGAPLEEALPRFLDAL